MAARKSALLIDVPTQHAEAAPETTPKSGFAVLEGRADRVDPLALVMDQALGLEASGPFSTMSRWNSHAVDFALSLAPAVCEVFSLAVKACVEIQLNWLAWIPGWQLGAEPDQRTSSEISEAERRLLAESMDVAIGTEQSQPVSGVLPFAEPVDRATRPVVAEATEDEESELPAKALAAAG